MYKLEEIHKKIDNMRIKEGEIQQIKPAGFIEDTPTSKKKQENSLFSEEDKIKSILSKSIVVDTSEGDSLGKEFVAMAKEYTDPKNRFIFGHTTQMFIFEDSLLEAISIDFKNSADRSLQELGKFIENFRFSYHTGRSAIKGQMRESFTEFGSSLLAFRGALEWRNAGVKDQAQDPEQRNLWDRLRK